MLWGALLFLYAVLHTHTIRLRDRSRPPSIPSWFRLPLALYGCMAAAGYFAFGFEPFVLAYAASVTALVLVAWRTLVKGELPATRSSQRLLAIAASLYGGGFLFLWIPGELLCRHVPLMQRLPMHAVFHLTSTAGPHLGLTSLALARYEVEQPTAPSSMYFAGMPAIERPGEKNA